MHLHVSAPVLYNIFFSYKIAIIYALKIEHVEHDLLRNDNVYECSVHWCKYTIHTMGRTPSSVYYINTSVRSGANNK